MAGTVGLSLHCSQDFTSCLARQLANALQQRAVSTGMHKRVGTPHDTVSLEDCRTAVLCGEKLPQVGGSVACTIKRMIPYCACLVTEVLQGKKAAGTGQNEGNRDGHQCVWAAVQLVLSLQLTRMRTLLPTLSPPARWAPPTLN